MRLLEFTFAEIHEIIPILEKHKGKDRYIHFSKLKNKIGVNPKASHTDPSGVYFYPVDFLLKTRREDVEHGTQYGVDFGNYVVAEITLNPDDGINLSTISDDEVDAILRKNNITEYLGLPSSTKLSPWGKQLPDILKEKGGKRLYSIMNYLAGRKIISPNAVFKGFKWISDHDGNFHKQEKEQVCVRDLSIVKVVDTGSYSNKGLLRTAYLMLEMLMKKLGKGEVMWKYAKPHYEGEYNGYGIQVVANRNGKRHVNFDVSCSTDSRIPDFTYLTYGNNTAEKELGMFMEMLERQYGTPTE